MRRVFIAIDISDEARQVATAHTDELRRRFRNVRVSWVRPENLHITIKFVGDTSDEQVEKVAKAMNEVAKEIPPFEASISMPHAFGRRSLVIEIADKSAGFQKINRLIGDECENLGIPRENRPFRPHLTIARIRGQKGSKPLIAGHIAAKFEPVDFEVSAVTMYESKLLPGGSIYTKLESFPLGVVSEART